MQLTYETPLAGSPAWELSLSVAGVSYPIREVTLKEFNAITSKSGLTADEEVGFILSMVAGEQKPDRELLIKDADLRDWMSTAITAYLMAHVEKKRVALRTQVQAALSGTAGRRST